MFSSITQELQNLIRIVAGNEGSSAGDDFVNVLLSFNSRGCPRLYSESDHTVEFLLGRHIDGAIERAEHTTAVCGGGVWVVLNLAHMGEGIINMAAVLCAIFFFHIFVQSAVEGVDNNAVGEAVVVNDLQNTVADLICHCLVTADGVFLELDIKGHCGMILHKLHKFDKCGDLFAREFRALPRTCVEGLELRKHLVADLARAVGGAVDGCIVNADKLAVTGDTNVGFYLVNADLDSLFEREKGVFGVKGAPTAVRGNVYVILRLSPVIHFLPPKVVFYNYITIGAQSQYLFLRHILTIEKKFHRHYSAEVFKSTRAVARIMAEGHFKERKKEMNSQIRRGDIYYADLSPVVGSEQGGLRPVLIIQNDVGNKYSPTVIAAAITSRMSKTRLPTHIDIYAERAGLARDSVILLEQIRTLDKRRLRERMGHLDDEMMNRVNSAIAVSFGIMNAPTGGYEVEEQPAAVAEAGIVAQSANDNLPSAE